MSKNATPDRNTAPLNDPVSNATARNALKHGLTSTNFCLLADEDRQRFDDHRASLELALAPRNVIESIHVARLVETSWLIFRASLIEAKAITVQMDYVKQAILGNGNNPTASTAALQLLGGEFVCFRALEELERRSNVLDKLNRYRTTHERSFHRNLSALQKLRGPGRPLVESLPSTCLEIMNGTQTIFDLKPPASQHTNAPSQTTDSTPDIENCETKPTTRQTAQTPSRQPKSRKSAPNQATPNPSPPTDPHPEQFLLLT